MDTADQAPTWAQSKAGHTLVKSGGSDLPVMQDDPPTRITEANVTSY